MKSLFLCLIFTTISNLAIAQGQDKKVESLEIEQISADVKYKLFPTKNYWTFLKLDTSNGKMWQVHFSVKSEGARGEVYLNLLPLVNEEDEVNGRFTLYPTENFYNFILLDQIEGTLYQVQWSMDAENRGIVPID